MSLLTPSVTVLRIIIQTMTHDNFHVRQQFKVIKLRR